MHIHSDPHSSYVSAFFELPGIKSSEITVNVTRDGKLYVSGERRPPEYIQSRGDYQETCPVQEFKFGRFQRVVDVMPGLEVCALSNRDSCSLLMRNQSHITSMQALMKAS